MRILLLLLLIIDPFNLLGKWTLKFSEANFNLINSPAFRASSQQQQEEIIEVNELYLKNSYYEFKIDTVYWIDVNQKEKKIVKKKGKWMVVGDTLRIFDFDRIGTYNFLLVNLNENEFVFKYIFPNGDIARSVSVFEKEKVVD